jgi:hypothetical protein
MAVACACKIDLEEIFFNNLRYMTNSYNFCPTVRRILNEHLPANAHEICNKKVIVCFTQLTTLKPIYVSEFKSKEDLINAIIASCFIPRLTSSNLHYKYDGHPAMDGSFSDFLPKGDIRICCIPFEIIKKFPTLHDKKNISIALKSKIYENIYALSPGPNKYYKHLHTQGYLDMSKYLDNAKLGQ